MSTEKKLKELQIKLPPAPRPVGSYVPAVRAGSLLFLSGALPLDENGLTHKGKVGQNFTIEQAALAARQCGLNLIALMRQELGDLDQVHRVVSLTGYINGVDGFEDAAAVMNGASDLVSELFGDKGAHARAAVSVNGLPKGAAVEVAAIIEIAG